MGKVKISFQHDPDRFHGVKFRLKKKKDATKVYCKGCGSVLTDALSIKRGYGRECFAAVPLVIVLDIQAEESK
jgi:TATA-box binding protein (TBP) (component of TFIID and TFIIIB)